MLRNQISGSIVQRNIVGADISNLPDKADLQVVNEGVKKASILVPHNEDI